MNLKKATTIFVLTLLAWGAFAKPSSIKGTIKNAEKYKSVYFFEYCGLDYFLVDSATMNNGVFTFSPKKNYTRGVYRIGPKKELSFEVIYSATDLEFTADLSDLEKSFKVVKSDENKAYQDYVGFIRSINEKSKLIQGKANGLQGLAQTDPNKYKEEIAKLQKEMDSLNASINEKYKIYDRIYPNFYIGKLCKFLMQSDNISTTLLNDAELAKGTAIPIKIISHYQKKHGNDLAKMQESVNATLSNIKNNICLEAAYAGMIAYFVQADPKFSQNLYSRLEQNLPDAKYLKEIKMMLPKREPEVGDMAPDITLADTTGKMVSLSQYRGKVILLDFWASWCGPCRRENPNVVKIYNQYKDKGFFVFGVSLDQDGKRWKEAIVKDNLTWAHISDLKGWQSYGAQLYQVKGIPQTYLIDESGKILAKNLRGVDLELKLESLFADKK
jgi:peroxiredoxin